MYDFTIIRSKRKTVSLEIREDGTLEIRAPKRYTDQEAQAFLQANVGWIEKHRPGIMKKYGVLSALSKNDEKVLKSAAELLLPQLTAQWAQVMGVHPTGVRITSAKKRFGSCGSDNGICFSRYLLLYPPEAVTFVVVHELAHIRHHNHGAAFHALVRATLPEADAWEDLLHPENADFTNLTRNLDILRKKS